MVFYITEDLLHELTKRFSIGKDGPKTTSKVLSAVALGIPILSDSWPTQSAKEKRLVDTLKYAARNAEREKELSLPDNWSFGGQPRSSLLANHEIYITPALKKAYGTIGYNDIVELLRILGATKVFTSTRLKPDFSFSKNTLIMALPQGDFEAITIHNKGYACYDKDFLGISVLRGQLCLNDFKIVPAEVLAKKKGAETPATKKKGDRSSLG